MAGSAKRIGRSREPAEAPRTHSDSIHMPRHFHAKKGDVLIWHANLIHGGSARKNLELSRRALVCHFFVNGAFVYHDLASARSKQQYFGICLLRDEEGDIRLFGNKKAAHNPKPH